MDQARRVDDYSISELKQLLRGLGGDSKGLLEKSEFVAAVEVSVKSASVKELKAKVSVANCASNKKSPPFCV
jgi:hypothetical protein